MMRFLLAKQQTMTTEYFPLNTDAYSKSTLTMVFSVTGDMLNGHVHTDRVGFSKRCRSFRIDRLEVVWDKDNDEPMKLRSVIATGTPVLADGTLSDRSVGRTHWWPGREMPLEITTLLSTSQCPVT